jgi:hypothetical protein
MKNTAAPSFKGFAVCRRVDESAEECNGASPVMTCVAETLTKKSQVA